MFRGVSMQQVFISWSVGKDSCFACYQAVEGGLKVGHLVNMIAGEYHTFVTDGPLFKRRVEILETNRVLREGHWFLEILESELRAK